MKRWGHIVACGMFLFLRPMAHPRQSPIAIGAEVGAGVAGIGKSLVAGGGDPDALQAILASDFLHVVAM